MPRFPRLSPHIVSVALAGAASLVGCAREPGREARPTVAVPTAASTPAPPSPPPAVAPTTGCTEVAKLAPFRYDPAATLLADGRVLLSGGRQHDDGGYLRDVAVFEPKTRSVRPVAPMHEPRGRHGAARLPDGRVLVAGGRTLAIEVYDPVADRWTVVGKLGQSVWHPVVAKLASGHVLIAGGDMLWKGAWLDETWWFDGTRLHAGPKNALGTAPRQALLAADGTSLLIAAESPPAQEAPCVVGFREDTGYSTTPPADARAMAWCRAPSLGTAPVVVRADERAVWAATETAIVRLDAPKGQWTEVARYQRAHVPGATLLADGHTVLVVGGLDEASTGVELCTLGD